MKIKKLMVRDPITITDDASIETAIELMKANSIRHLPVTAKGNILKGFLTLADLKQGMIPYMLGDLTLKDLMIKNPITVDPEDEIETAARLIYKYKIGGIPVVRNKKLVGIVTGTDMLRAFIDMMGMLTTSSRIDVVIADEPDALRSAVNIINENGGDIINVGMTAQETHQRTYYFRLSLCKTEPIKSALEKAGFVVPYATD